MPKRFFDFEVTDDFPGGIAQVVSEMVLAGWTLIQQDSSTYHLYTSGAADDTDCYLTIDNTTASNTMSVNTNAYIEAATPTALVNTILSTSQTSLATNITPSKTFTFTGIVDEYACTLFFKSTGGEERIISFGTLAGTSNIPDKTNVFARTVADVALTDGSSMQLDRDVRPNLYRGGMRMQVFEKVTGAVLPVYTFTVDYENGTAPAAYSDGSTHTITMDNTGESGHIIPAGSTVGFWPRRDFNTDPILTTGSAWDTEVLLSPSGSIGSHATPVATYDKDPEGAQWGSMPHGLEMIYLVPFYVSVANCAGGVLPHVRAFIQLDTNMTAATAERHRIRTADNEIYVTTLGRSVLVDPPYDTSNYVAFLGPLPD